MNSLVSFDKNETPQTFRDYIKKFDVITKRGIEIVLADQSAEFDVDPSTKARLMEIFWTNVEKFLNKNVYNQIENIKTDTLQERCIKKLFLNGTFFYYKTQHKYLEDEFDDFLKLVCKVLEIPLKSAENYESIVDKLPKNYESLFDKIKSNILSKLYITAVNYNVLRIMSGMGGLAYSN